MDVIDTVLESDDRSYLLLDVGSTSSCLSFKHGFIEHLALKSFNTEKQCLNIIFNPIDISAIVYITIELPYDVKKRLENSETKYVF